MLLTGRMQLAVGAALIIGFLIVRKNLTDAIAGVTGVVADAAGDATAGVAIGIGDVIGVPRTNESECEKAMREGRTWDASFACPAKTFIDYTINGYPAASIDRNNRMLQ
jgi:hypothetical protein